MTSRWQMPETCRTQPPKPSRAVYLPPSNGQRDGTHHPYRSTLNHSGILRAIRASLPFLPAKLGVMSSMLGARNMGFGIQASSTSPISGVCKGSCEAPQSHSNPQTRLPGPGPRIPRRCFSRGQPRSPTVKCLGMVPIPLTDHIRRRTFWAVTLLLIVTNFWAFFIELSLGPHLNRFILLNGLIPARYSPACPLRASGKTHRGSHFCFHVPPRRVAAHAGKHALSLCLRAQH